MDAHYQRAGVEAQEMLQQEVVAKLTERAFESRMGTIAGLYN